MYIAEIGWNFMGDMSLAEEMICSAASSGATHVKFQYWREENLKPGPWDKDGRREIYIAAQLDKNKIKLISNLANKYGVVPFFSVFNQTDAKAIKGLGFDIIKIPSMEVTNLELVSYCLDNFKTVYFSAGACTSKEFEIPAKLINETSNKVILMHCVSCYPCLAENANLVRLNYMANLCPNTTLGLSDHTSSTILPAVAASFNAVAIEKHFTTNRDLPGRDNKFALLPKEFEIMVNNHKEATKGLIDHGFDYQECEQETVDNYRGRWNY